MQADLVLYNGKLYTQDSAHPHASALAVRCGRVAAVGDDQDIRSWAGAHTECIDARGRVVLPGFADAHMHLVWYSLGLTQVQLEGVASLAAAVERVAERARRTPPGEWIRGLGWNCNLWPGGRFPGKEDLDPVTPDHPVMLLSKDGHSAWVNSRALQLAGITAATPDPPGGVFERYAQSGEPTGLLREGPAMQVAEQAAGPPSLEVKAAALQVATRHLHTLGVVSVQSPEEEHDWTALQQVWQRGELGLRVNVMITTRWLEHVRSMGLRAGLGDSLLRLSAVKIFADGALGSRSADMFEPYDDEPENRGIEVTSTAQLEHLVSDCCAAGWNMAIHAIGDRANHRVLDVLETQRAEWMRQGLRPRIEHVQLLAPTDVKRLAQIGIVASMQPIHCTSDYVMADKHWGKRCHSAYAWRSVLDSGAVLAFGSDAPVEEPDVLRGIHAAVTRQRADGSPAGGWHAEQCLSVAEAVHAYTQGAAYAIGEEHNQGSLSVGKWADMVILSQDIMNLPPPEILNTRVEATFLAGKPVYCAS